MTRIPGAIYRPDIAVLTALPKEHAAVQALMDHPVSHTETDHQGTRHYTFGTMPARNDGKHAIALAMVGVGNNISAIATTQLLNDLPSVRTVILSGIAGGIPNPAKADDHVRLGDIVVSSEQGIVQFDFMRDESPEITPRHPPRPASSNLLRAARMLEADAIHGLRPWEDFIDQILSALQWKRPSVVTDKLASTNDPAKLLKHPKDLSRINGRPRVFLATIASSNTLLKNPVRRDELRRRHGAKAVEMEGSGTADAAWMAQAHHFVIRGICDYCDAKKGDGWQNYAAAAAAGYLRSLLARVGEAGKRTRCPVTTDSVRPEAARSETNFAETLNVDGDTLHQIEATQNRLLGLLADGNNEARLLIPTLSWITSIDRKFHQHRLLEREARALQAIHAEVQQAGTAHSSFSVSPIKRLSLNLLEHYQDSPILRSNWEVRCAIGNLLTLAVSEPVGSTSTLVSEVMQKSVSGANWDLAQMLFDALHHAAPLTSSGRDFLLTTAIEHEHSQVRWNVAAGLKSIRLPEGDLRKLSTQLLHDSSRWVAKELIDVALKNDGVLREISSPKNADAVLELLGRDSQLVEHTLLTLRSQDRRVPLSQFPSFISQIPLGYRPSDAPGGDRGAEPAGRRKRILQEDYRRVEQIKSELTGQHGKLYKAAERVVNERLASNDAELRQEAISAYLHSAHDALAWASVRALFGGRLDGCPDDFLREAVASMLTHSSEWIRRECVEETLRLPEGRKKYICLRQIEEHRAQLAEVDEIRPYLIQINIQA